MKLDILATGPAGFRERARSGGDLHAAEVTSRLPRYGLEVAYVPYPSMLLRALRDEELASSLIKLVKDMERNSVMIPNSVYDFLENREKYLEKYFKDRKYHDRLDKLPWPFNILTNRLSLTAKGILWGYYFPDNYIRESFVMLSLKIRNEISDVKSLLNLTDAPSDFPIMANVFKKPIYQLLLDNFNWCDAPLKVALRLAPTEEALRTLVNIYVPSCYRTLKTLYQQLIERAPVKILLINPVSVNRFIAKLPETKTSLKSIYTLYPGNAINPLALEQRSFRKSYYLLFGGHINMVKGIYDLPYILKYLKEDNIDIKIIITGHLESRARTIINKLRNIYPRVTLLGFVKDRRILYRLYANARALIYPSHVDSYSLTILDSLGAGTPVVAYGLPEFVYLYRNIRPVRLVKEFDFRAFASELTRLAKIDNTEELFNDEQVQEFIRLHSSWDNVAEQYAKILTS